MDNENKIVAFQNDTAPTIAAIIKKYGLEESPEIAFQKIQEGKPFNAGIILSLAKDVVLKKIDGLTLTASLVEQFKIPQDVAANVSREIQENLIPGAIETDAPVVKPKEPEDLNFPEPIGGIRKIVENTAQTEPAVSEENEKPEEIKEKIPKENPLEKKMPEKITENPRQAKESDSYREPIE